MFIDNHKLFTNLATHQLIEVQTGCPTTFFTLTTLSRYWNSRWQISTSLCRDSKVMSSIYKYHIVNARLVLRLFLLPAMCVCDVRVLRWPDPLLFPPFWAAIPLYPLLRPCPTKRSDVLACIVQNWSLNTHKMRSASDILIKSTAWIAERKEDQPG
jgi:hypothetical protein